MHPLLPVLALQALRNFRSRRSLAAGGAPEPRVAHGHRVPGALRLGAYAAVAALALGAIGARAAHAEAGGAALSLGRELGALAAERGDPGGATVRLNGQAFHVAESATSRTVHEALDTVERACRERPGALSDLFAAVPARGTAGGLPYELPASFTRGIVRNETEREGVVVCLVDGARRPLPSALKAFAASQDLGDLGRVRYVYARRATDGATTALTLAWTDAHFDLKKIGAGGEDDGSEGRAPRPPGARRWLVAEVDGTPHATRFYDTRAPVADVTAHYDRALQDAGFQRFTPGAREQVLRAYFRADLHVLVAVRREGERTVFAVTETTPPRGAAAFHANGKVVADANGEVQP
ncbi:MAG: hypothetical protein IPF92_13605 [Myxococcales bacterium]|nr:hypothetical protein [Myxococcales bacterium]MBL0194909.1 hypothetical protein [Myxococcales bacterium]HQY61211.1 hypothetical protein [Polyangiaceae bacterium]